MDSVSVAEFRKNMKAMLDSALNDPVFIRRGDDIYQLSHYGEVGVVAKGTGVGAFISKDGGPWVKDTPKKIAGAAPGRQKLVNDLANAKYDAMKWGLSTNSHDEAIRLVSARTPADVLKEIDTLKATLEAEKAENELNQDPDYWADFNKRYKQIDELWAEYHRLKGTK